jgi:membrane-bound metal-dependent hydrolase YbcI (DUF457 family)
MTLVGHSLVGAAIGTACMPDALTGPLARVVFLTGFMIFANVPDIPLRNWGHHRYDISHSVPVTLVLIAVIAAGIRLSGRGRRTIGSPQVLIGGAAAWLSHMLLDSFYNHGLGLMVWWPLFNVRLALPIPWLANVSMPWLSAENTRVCLIELATYLPLVLIAVGWRLWRRARLAEGLRLGT